jgi:hypothetical protein
MVILDEGDGPDLFIPPGLPRNFHYERNDPPPHQLYYIAYFKRSFVRRRDGVYRGVMSYGRDEGRDVFPITYTILEAYVNTEFPLRKIRNIDIVCTSISTS